jgi:ribonuclease Y
MQTMIYLAAAGLTGLAAGFAVRTLLARSGLAGAERRAAEILRKAREEAASLARQAEVKAREEMLHARDEFEAGLKNRRTELAATEERMAQREAVLDKKIAALDRKETALEEKTRGLEDRERKVESLRAEAEKLAARQEAELHRIAQMTREEARHTVLARLEGELQNEAGALVRRVQEQARETADREATRIVSLAIERYAAGHAGEMMTSSVALPSEDMKGRIIGRDGRNIRSLEAATGVTVLVDDTPEAVVLSGFDPVRREVARQALEMLLADGRIHPARIEEVVEKVRAQVDGVIRMAGEEALLAVDVQGVEPELVQALGRLKFRTSYSQNVLQHSLEVAHLMGAMAAELHLDPALARRVGVFHDIGKALDHEIEGSHAAIGADLLKRGGEKSPLVINAVAAHHEEVEKTSAYAVLCAAADAISSSRVGARTASAGQYVKRLEKLEAIADGFAGVKKSFAIQAGRELRVLVDPERTDDARAMVLARDICNKIESELKYPGQIRVTVIRETRCVEYAH